MSLTDQLLAALLVYGLPLLFAVTLIGAIGVPFLPTTLMLVATGSFAEQGDMQLVAVISTGILAAVLGDVVGYSLARWGGRRLVLRLGARVGVQAKVQQAEALAERWGAMGIFLTRWLFTAAGPWVNVVSGLAHFSRKRFLFWAVLGETVWVVALVLLGYHLSGQVQAVGEMLSDLGPLLLGVLLLGLLGWQLKRSFRRG